MISCCALVVLSCEEANTLGPFQATPLKLTHELLHFALPSHMDLIYVNFLKYANFLN